mmetsp:Transcript_80500/g.228038  ORF Transcript_80500/g.228038 Transcript_80500/m.228038 type:complete len:99 (+) Transcript_80500:690-986(+)
MPASAGAPLLSQECGGEAHLGTKAVLSTSPPVLPEHAVAAPPLSSRCCSAAMLVGLSVHECPWSFDRHCITSQGGTRAVLSTSPPALPTVAEATLLSS